MTICPPLARRYCPASTNQPAGRIAQYTGQATASAIALKKSRVFALPVQALADASLGVARGDGVTDGLAWSIDADGVWTEADGSVVPAAVGGAVVPAGGVE